MNKNNSFSTAGFIFILIFIRISCHTLDFINVIVYSINVVGFLYVIIQIQREVYGKLTFNISVNSNNVVMQRRNKKVKNIFIRSTIGMVFLFAFAAFVLNIFISNDIFTVVNDTISLFTLGISIEDSALQECIYNIIAKS